MKTIEDALAHADEFDGPGSELRSVVMLAAEVRRLREENERLRENAKTISELEQLAARSNNELLVENERLADDMERCYRMLLSEPDVKGALFKAENILRESLADRSKK